MDKLLDPTFLRAHAQQIARWLFDASAPPPAGISSDRAAVALALCEQLFLKAPPCMLDDNCARAFDQLIDECVGAPRVSREIAYDLPYPKHDFLRHLAWRRGYLLHGSSNTTLERLRPQPQSDWAGRSVNAVFASSDSIWPLFFACIPQTGWPGSLRNACLIVDTPAGQSERFYFFSINERVLPRANWVKGMIYILARDTFKPASEGPVRFDEWISADETPVVARLSATPEDFPFLSSVAGHPEEEPIFETWLHYKSRLANAG